LSEHEGERAVAVMLCDHCPILTECRDHAEENDERWGVWGGKDFSRRPGKKLQQAA
jgi:WhiB family redox-sensing transcriptional regulator